jgi:hypothetical protein
MIRYLMEGPYGSRGTGGGSRGRQNALEDADSETILDTHRGDDDGERVLVMDRTCPLSTQRVKKDTEKGTMIENDPNQGDGSPTDLNDRPTLQSLCRHRLLLHPRKETLEIQSSRRTPA